MKRFSSLLMILLVCALLTAPAAYAKKLHSTGSAIVTADTIPYPGPDDTDDDGGCGGGGGGGNDDGPDSTDGGSSGWGGNDDGPDSTGGVLF